MTITVSTSGDIFGFGCNHATVHTHAIRSTFQGQTLCPTTKDWRRYRRRRRGKCGTFHASQTTRNNEYDNNDDCRGRRVTSGCDTRRVESKSQSPSIGSCRSRRRNNQTSPRLVGLGCETNDRRRGSPTAFGRILHLRRQSQSAQQKY